MSKITIQLTKDQLELLKELLGYRIDILGGAIEDDGGFGWEIKELAFAKRLRTALAKAKTN